jgi:hypothetical protein
LTKDDAVRLTEEYLFPFAGVLDRQQADANWNISIKSDFASITRIALEHKSRKRGGWLPTQTTRAEAIILNNGAGPCPQNIPSHFAIWGAPEERHVTIRSWQANGPNPPAIQDFRPPDERAGWQVFNGLDLSDPAAAR